MYITLTLFSHDNLQDFLNTMDKKTAANTTETVPAKTLEELALELAKVGDELTQKYDPQYKKQLQSATTDLLVRIGQEVVFFLIREGAI